MLCYSLGKNSKSFFFCLDAGRQLTHMSNSLHQWGSICGEWLSRSGGSQRDELDEPIGFSKRPPLILHYERRCHPTVAYRLNGRSVFRAKQRSPSVCRELATCSSYCTWMTIQTTQSLNSCSKYKSSWFFIVFYWTKKQENKITAEMN